MKDKKLQKNLMLTCFLSGCLEIYDFTIFGFLTKILHQHYFIFLNEAQALLVSYGIFAVGFIFRPLGSIIFGTIGDKYGRKIALTASIILMGLASLGMAILPSYQVIGAASCYIILLLRIFQGISVGGEYSGAIIFAIEHSDKKKAGFVGSIVVSGCMCGVLLASIVSNILTIPFLPEYSWRFAFLLGFILSIIGFFIRVKFSETPEFKRIQRSKNLLPLLQGLKISWQECIATIFIAATSGVNLYFITVYLPNYISKITGTTAGSIATIATLIMALLIPFFGYFSDKLGRIKLMLYGATGLPLSASLMIGTIYHSYNYISAVLVVTIHAFVASIFCGPMNTLIIEIFSPENRYSCSGFSYSIGMGIIGGTAPFIATILSQNSSNISLNLSIYLCIMSLLGMIGVLIASQKTKLYVFNYYEKP